MDRKGKAGAERVSALGVKQSIDAWGEHSGSQVAPIFQRVYVSGRAGEEPLPEKSIWGIVNECASALGLGIIAPHDLRRTCAKLCRARGGELEQIQFLLGQASIATTQRYLGSEQYLENVVNDTLEIE